MCIKGVIGFKKVMFFSVILWKNKGDLVCINNFKNDNMKVKISLIFFLDVINGEKCEKNFKVNGYDKENDILKVFFFDQENGEYGEEEEDGNLYVVEEIMFDYGRKLVIQVSQSMDWSFLWEV